VLDAIEAFGLRLILCEDSWAELLNQCRKLSIDELTVRWIALPPILSRHLLLSAFKSVSSLEIAPF
jgi:hypothetical protein